MFWNNRIFVSGDAILAEVVDVEAARKWYMEKFDFGYASTTCEECDVILGYSENELFICICLVIGGERHDVPNHPPILFAKHVEKAHEFLSARRVDVGPIQGDSGGNQFFRYKDMEGNEVEVCQNS